MVEHRGKQPILPLGFFRHPTFAAGTLVGFLLNLTAYGSLFVLGLYFQQIGHWSPVRSGIALLPFATAIFVANIAAGRLAGIASPRAMMTAGLLVAAFGIWLLRDVDSATPYGVMLLGLILLPFGIGFAVPVMTSSLLATVPRVRAGVASGVLNSVRQAGGAIGVALFGGMMAAGSSGIADAFIAGTIVLGAAAAVAVRFIGAAPLTMLAGVARNAADNR